MKENPSEVQNDQRKARSNEPRNKLSTSRTQKKECESCHEMVYVTQFYLHFKSCKIYFLDMKKLPSGFECRLCSHQTTHNEGLALKPRIRMYNHLKDSHSEKFDISNRDEMQEDKKPERNNKNDQLKAEKMPERKNENDIMEDNCQLCNEIISETTLSDHVLSCLFYPAIIKKPAIGFGYECIECQFKSEAKSAFNVIQNHIKFAHSDKVLISKYSDRGYECCECEFKSEAKSALNIVRNHIRFVHPEKVSASNESSNLIENTAEYQKTKKLSQSKSKIHKLQRKSVRAEDKENGPILPKNAKLDESRHLVDPNVILKENRKRSNQLPLILELNPQSQGRHSIENTEECHETKKASQSKSKTHRLQRKTVKDEDKENRPILPKTNQSNISPTRLDESRHLVDPNVILKENRKRCNKLPLMLELNPQSQRRNSIENTEECRETKKLSQSKSKIHKMKRKSDKEEDKENSPIFPKNTKLDESRHLVNRNVTHKENGKRSNKFPLMLELNPQSQGRNLIENTEECQETKKISQSKSKIHKFQRKSGKGEDKENSPIVPKNNQNNISANRLDQSRNLVDPNVILKENRKRCNNLNSRTDKNKGGIKRIKNSSKPILTIENQSDEIELKEHKNVEEIDCYKCKLCPYKSASVELMAQHFTTNHEVGSDFNTATENQECHQNTPTTNNSVLMEVKSEVQKSDFKSVSKFKVESNEPTTIVECPMCSKPYTLLSDLGDHMTKFHRIPLNIQRKLLKGKKSLAIIQEDL